MMIYGKDYFGFLYLWYDRRRKMFYLGSHMGSVDDGYICSSTWMRNTYNRHKEDFRRKIVYFHIENDRMTLLKEEERWLQMMKPEELRKRYYNHMRHTIGKPAEEVSEQFRNHWANTEARANHIESMSKSWTPERKAAHIEKLKRKWESGAYEGRDVTPKTPEAAERKKSMLGKKQSEYQKQRARQARQKTWEVTYPDGSKHIVQNLLQWSKENNNPGIYRTVDGSRPHSKGFSAKQL